MEKTKVLHIIKSLGRGGAEMLLPETLGVHNKEEFDFHYIYFLPWKDQMVKAIKDRGGKVTCFPAKNNLMLMLKVHEVVRYVRDHKIQLIHAHLPWAGILARLVGKLTGVPVIYTEHNKQERYHAGTRFMNLATMNWLRKIIPVSADVEESIRKNKRGLNISIQTIPNGVNTDHFAPGLFDGSEVRNSFKIPETATVIGTIAVFRFQKRLDLWLELTSEILIKAPDTHFIIIGDGPLKPALLQKQRNLMLQERVHFAGLQTEIRPYVAAMDVYMMSSIFEGLPIALLEAMSLGCPVISTDAGGIKEVIRHKTDGLLCPADDPHQLTDFAVTLISNADQRKTLGANGRERVKEAFSIARMVKELEGVYRELAAGSGSQASG